LICFLFQGHDDSVETFDVGSVNAMDNRAFQGGQMMVYATREFSPFCRWSHHECAPICFAHFARDQSTLCQTIENAG